MSGHAKPWMYWIKPWLQDFSFFHALVCVCEDTVSLQFDTSMMYFRQADKQSCNRFLCVCVCERKKKKSRRGCDVILTPLSSSSRLRIESWREKRGRWDWKEALRRLQGKTCKKVGPILILYSKFENILQTFFFFKKINVVFFVWGIWLPVSDPVGSLHPIKTLAWMLLAGCCTFGPDLQPHFAWTHFVPWRDSLYFCIYQRLGTNGDKEWKLITNQNVKY